MAAKHRLQRLQRLEKVRAIAKQNAAREAAAAESTLSQLEMLAARTGQLMADYSARRGASDGAELRQFGAFRAGLQGVSEATSADALRARHLADHKLLALAAAERARQAVEDRAMRETESIARGSVEPVLAGRRTAIGTPLE